MRRIWRQRAIEVGKPVDVPLKPMALNPVQKKEFSDLHVQPLVDQKHQIMTPKRVSVMAALGLHLIAVLLGAYYVVKPARLDAETTNVEIVHSIPTRSVRQQITRRDAFKPTEILRPPSFRNKVEPQYTIEAKRAGKEGKVVLIATIDVDGKAKDIVIKEDTVGFGCARAAIVALEASLFWPGERGDESVPIRIAIPNQFKLED